MIASTRESIMRLEADLNAFRYAERKLSDDLSLKVAANSAPANGAATSHASVYSYTGQASREIPSTNVEKPEVMPADFPSSNIPKEILSSPSTT